MLLSVIPEEFQEIGSKILNKCAKQGKSKTLFIDDNCYFIVGS